MNIPFRLIGTSAMLAFACTACLGDRAFAQEGQQYNCAPGTILRYDECEPVAASVPAVRSPAQTPRSPSVASGLRAAPLRVAHQQATPPRLARHVKPPPSGSLPNPSR